MPPLAETLTLHDLLSKVPEDHPLQLTHLALNSTGIRIDSFTLPHLRSLISLDLRNLPAPSNVIDNPDVSSERLERACSTYDICAILKQEGIYLKHVVVSDAEGVFDYLCSYSGLETLDLCSISFDSVQESNTSAQTFYKSVLPQLVHSLQVLKIQPKQEGRWCFNPEDDFQSVALFQCNKLRSLSVALNSTSFLRSIDFFYSSRDSVIHQFKDSLGDEVCPRRFHFSSLTCNNHCRSHHLSIYHSAYPSSVRFILSYQNWDLRVMSLFWASRI